MILCPSVSNAGALCTYQTGHPGPHRGVGERGNTITWGFRTASRPMYPKAGEGWRPRQRPFHEDSSPKQCPETYTEGGVSFQCVREAGHPGWLHRCDRLQWTVKKEHA